MSHPIQRHQIDPDRLAPGVWSEEFNKFVGEGDIARSYCADTISMHGTTRQPFVFHGDLWITISLSYGSAKAYNLIPIDDFNADEILGQNASNDDEARRAQELGFYHGLVVSYRNDWFVLTGPPACFEPGKVVQPGLFAEF